MTVESYRASALQDTTTWLEVGAVWDIANFISGCSSWDIIDSWRSTTYVAPTSENTIFGRYKGDPIADAQWTGAANIGHGCGIVIEQANPRSGYPPLQIVWQAGGSNSLGYISGHSYRHDRYVSGVTSFQGSCWRIGTQGDWDLNDLRPDFADTKKASDTFKQDFDNHGSSSICRMYASADDDWLTLIQSRDDLKIFKNMIWFGQYTTKRPTQESVVNPAYGIFVTNASGSYILDPSGNGSGDFLNEVAVSYQLFGCLDENGVFQEWGCHINPGLKDWLFNRSTQPNEFDSVVGVDLYEILVRGLTTYGPDTRLIGSLRGVYAAMRLGMGATFNNRQHMCLGHGYGVVVEWDGSTVV